MKSIQARLGFSFLCIIILLFIQGLVAYWNIKSISNIQARAYERKSRLNDIALRLASARLLVFKILGSMNPHQMDRLNAQFKTERSYLEKALAKEGIDKEIIEKNFREYSKIINLHYDFSVRTARRLINLESKSIHESLVDRLKTLSRIVQKESEEEINHTYQNSLRFTLGLLGSALIIAILLAIVLARTLIDRQQAEKGLRESEERYRRLTENSPDMIYRMSLPDGQYEYVNPAASLIFGYSPQKWYDNPILIRDIIHPDWHQYFTDQWERLQKGIVPPTYDYQIIHRDGTVRWLNQRNVAVKDSDGQVIAFEGIVTDITERKNAEKALKASHERFLTVLDSIDATIYVADMETYEILFMNKHMIKTFGRDMTGEICWEAFRGESNPCRHCTNDRLIDDLGNPTDVCIWQDKNPITGNWYMNYDRAIEWTDGRLVRLQIATDISNLKSMEEELRQAHKMEAIGTLTGGVAHDFNNILGIIIGNTELALDDLSERNPVRSYIEEIKTAGMRAKDVVRQLLSFSRKSEQYRRPLNIIPILKESMQLLRASIPTTIEIQFDIEENIGDINADPTQIQQVIINLCTNASQAMEKDGGILKLSLKLVSLEKGVSDIHNEIGAGRYVQLTIRDTGLGISPEIQDKIFDPYFTTKEVGKGSGMGLAIVHGIVMNHGGTISFISKLGKGTTFKILLPVCEEVRVEEEQYQNITPTGDERLLVIDDEESIVKMTKDMLERLGYDVETKVNPAEAFELFQSSPQAYDLIISDMTMPNMTGAMLSEKMKAIRSDIPVIICTGHSSLIDEAEAKKLGISAFIMKPVEMNDIAGTIRRVLDKTKNREIGNITPRILNR